MSEPLFNRINHKAVKTKRTMEESYKARNRGTHHLCLHTDASRRSFNWSTCNCSTNIRLDHDGANDM